MTGSSWRIIEETYFMVGDKTLEDAILERRFYIEIGGMRAHEYLSASTQYNLLTSS